MSGVEAGDLGLRRVHRSSPSVTFGRMTPTGTFPREAPRSTRSVAEKKLWRALHRHLPAGWTAWHSLRVRAPRGRDGEGDFVIAIPDRGALIVEVKGGRIQVRDGRWLQNGEELWPPPREQAFGYITVLKRQLALRHPGVALPYIAVATALPDTEWDAEPTNGDVAGAVLGEQDLPYLSDALTALVERLFKPIAPADGGWIDALYELWGESWIPAPSLGTRTRLAEARRVEIDHQQSGLLGPLDTNLRVHVAGAPGTGKTLLAMEVVRRWAARGRKPVLLCFTRGLATELRAHGCEAWTVRELAAEVLVRAGVPVDGGAPMEAWSPETWSAVGLLAADALARGPLPYDAVVVDEAQDFAPNDWALTRAIVRNGPLWTFGDEGQGFWADRREIPADVRPFVYLLEARHRCPAELAAFADRYRRGAPIVAEPAPNAGALRAVLAEDGDVEAACAAQLDRLLAGGVEPSQIAVLSLGGQTKTRIGVAERIGDRDVVRADDPRAREQVVADTFLRFKGLERPWVIVTELGLGASEYETRMHIALTRATVGCLIVATHGEVEQDERLKALTG